MKMRITSEDLKRIIREEIEKQEDLNEWIGPFSKEAREKRAKEKRFKETLKSMGIDYKDPKKAQAIEAAYEDSIEGTERELNSHQDWRTDNEYAPKARKAYEAVKELDKAPLNAALSSKDRHGNPNLGSLPKEYIDKLVGIFSVVGQRDDNPLGLDEDAAEIVKVFATREGDLTPEQRSSETAKVYSKILSTKKKEGKSLEQKKGVHRKKLEAQGKMWGRDGLVNAYHWDENLRNERDKLGEEESNLKQQRRKISNQGVTPKFDEHQFKKVRLARGSDDKGPTPEEALNDLPDIKKESLRTSLGTLKRIIREEIARLYA
jgi:hypothetical protein